MLRYLKEVRRAIDQSTIEAGLFTISMLVSGLFCSIALYIVIHSAIRGG